MQYNTFSVSGKFRHCLHNCDFSKFNNSYDIYNTIIHDYTNFTESHHYIQQIVNDGYHNIDIWIHHYVDTLSMFQKYQIIHRYGIDIIVSALREIPHIDILIEEDEIQILNAAIDFIIKTDVIADLLPIEI